MEKRVVIAIILSIAVFTAIPIFVPQPALKGGRGQATTQQPAALQTPSTACRVLNLAGPLGVSLLLPLLVTLR